CKPLPLPEWLLGLASISYAPPASLLRRSSAAVATSREDHHLPRSGPEGQHRRLVQVLLQKANGGLAVDLRRRGAVANTVGMSGVARLAAATAAETKPARTRQARKPHPGRLAIRRDLT